MKEQSRRQFLHCCLCLAASGGATALFTAPAGCEERDKTASTGSVKPGTESAFEAAYLELQKTGELKRRGQVLWRMMASCELCPRTCGVNRIEGEEGFCQASAHLEVSAFHPHFGEEKPLVGKGGSGTIFLTNCGLRCVFCINWEISQEGEGNEVGIKNLAEMMLRLQEMGCSNINVVTPTHYAAHIVLAVDIAASKGLRIPLVYNTCGWERIEILRLLDGIVDIYLPDFKYTDDRMASKYSSDADTYPEITKQALLEMHRQVGVARPAADGLMYRGLMIRHLVMPNNVSGTREVLRWIAESLSKDTYVNVMSQYRPMYKASDYPDIARSITRQEYKDAVRWAREAGLTRLDIQRYWF